jgi:hypothetical protein
MRGLLLDQSAFSAYARSTGHPQINRPLTQGSQLLSNTPQDQVAKRARAEVAAQTTGRVDMAASMETPPARDRMAQSSRLSTALEGGAGEGAETSFKIPKKRKITPLTDADRTDTCTISVERAGDGASPATTQSQRMELKRLTASDVDATVIGAVENQAPSSFKIPKKAKFSAKSSAWNR